MPLIGYKIETTSDNFGDLVRENCLLVDKTLMIKEFLEGKKTSLVIRPRRFGKTINHLRNLTKELYREHEKLLSSDRLSASDKSMFQKYLDGSIDNETLQASLKFLSEFLYKA